MAAEPSLAVKLCGTEEVDPPSRLLRAGPLSIEVENGNVRYVRIGGTEVLRAISFLVRDENWGTFTPSIDDLKIEEKSDRFAVTYRATCADAKRRLVYQARIEGASDCSLSFEVEAEAQTDVLTNRAGFVVLHPLVGVVGKPARVVHTDGREEMDRFPELIKPSQPIFDIRSLAHEIAPGVWATCTMEGDAFEMEDQRNWTDASYKTYVRPLSKPWPYTWPKGSRHRQSVRLALTGRAPAAAADGNATVTVELGRETVGRMPKIGVGVPAGEAQPALAHIEALRRLGPRLLVCQMDLRQGHGTAELEAYRKLAEATGADLVLEITVSGERTGDVAAELRTASAAAAKAGVKPTAVAVSPVSDLVSHQPGQEDPNVAPAEQIYAAARAAFPGVKLGGGMFSYFTELNRKRPPAGLLDYITHTTCPIVHAADDRSVMESLEALPSIIASTKAFGGAAQYWVGPSAIACRQNPYGKATVDNPKGGRVCLSTLDPRQRGLFAAAWILGYAAAFARGGVHAVTMGAPTGLLGFIHRRSDRPIPYFNDIGPSVYPAFHVMAGLAQSSGQALIEVKFPASAGIEAIAMRDGGRTTLWLANLTAKANMVTLAGVALAGTRIATLDATTFDRACRDVGALDALAQPLSGGKVTLDAYAVARIELKD